MSFNAHNTNTNPRGGTATWTPRRNLTTNNANSFSGGSGSGSASPGGSIPRAMSPANTNNNGTWTTNTAASGDRTTGGGSANGNPRYTPFRSHTSDAAYTPPPSSSAAHRQGLQVRGDDATHLAYSKNALLNVYKQFTDTIENHNPLPKDHPHVLAEHVNQPLALIPPSATEQEILMAGTVFPEPKKYDANARMAARAYVARGGQSNASNNPAANSTTSSGPGSNTSGSGGLYRPRRTLERGPSGFTTTTTGGNQTDPPQPTANGLSPTGDGGADTGKSPALPTSRLLTVGGDTASVAGSVASDPWSTAATGGGALGTDRAGSDVASVSAWSRRSRSRSPSGRGLTGGPGSAVGGRGGAAAIERLGTPGGAPPGLSGVSPASTSPGGLGNAVNGSATPTGGAGVPETWTLQEWYYRDPTGKVQGPFTSENMQEWLNGNYFELDLPVKATFRSSLGVTSDSGPFCALTDFARKFCGGDLTTPFLVAQYIPQGEPGFTSALDVGPAAAGTASLGVGGGALGGGGAAGYYDPFTGGPAAAAAGLRDPTLAHHHPTALGGAMAAYGALGAANPAGAMYPGAFGASVVPALHEYGTAAAAAAGAWGIPSPYGGAAAHHVSAQQHLHHGLPLGGAVPGVAWGGVGVAGRGMGGGLDPLYAAGPAAAAGAGWAGQAAYGAFPAGYGAGLPGLVQQQQPGAFGASPFERAVQDLRLDDQASASVVSSSTAAGPSNKLVVPEDSVSKASSKSPERSQSPASRAPVSARSPSPVPEPAKSKARTPSPVRRDPSPQPIQREHVQEQAMPKKAALPSPTRESAAESAIKPKAVRSPSPAAPKQQVNDLSALDVVDDDANAPWPVADLHQEPVQAAVPSAAPTAKASDKRVASGKKATKAAVSPVEDAWASAVPLAEKQSPIAKVDLPIMADFDQPSMDAWGMQEDAAAADVWASAALPSTGNAANAWGTPSSAPAPAPAAKPSKPRPAPVEAPWAKAAVAASSSAPKLSDIMKMEASKKGAKSRSDSGKARMPSVPPAGNESVTVLSWGTPTTALAGANKRQQQQHQAEDDKTDGGAASSVASAWQPAVTRTKSFAEIQAEEAHREAQRQKKRAVAEQERAMAAALLEVSGGTMVMTADPVSVASPTAAAKKGWGETPVVAAASIKAEMAKEKTKVAKAKAEPVVPAKRVVPGASSPTVSTTGGDAWVTVGSGAKPVRSASSASLSSSNPAAVSPSARVVAVAPAAPMPKVSAANSKRGISEETAKWAMTALKKLPGAAQVVPTLLTMFADFSVTDDSASDTVNTVAMLVLDLSTVVDGRAFAAEFVKRRRVDLGLPGTWAVATKSTQQQQKAKGAGAAGGSDFMVVSKKKKGGKKN